MNTDLKYDIQWTLITIEDPLALPGKSVFDVIQLISRVIHFKFIILDDIEGAGRDWLITTLQKQQNTVIEINSFLKELCDVIQFDWGDFFLFKEYPKKWDNPSTELYPYIIKQTDTTIRAIDDTYIYIYTPDSSVVNIILENYEIESIKTDFLEKLDYPY